VQEKTAETKMSLLYCIVSKFRQIVICVGIKMNLKCVFIWYNKG